MDEGNCVDCYVIVSLSLGIVLLCTFVKKRRMINPCRKAIFISGCDSGIGHRLAVLFHDLGCEVFAGCLRPETAREALPAGVKILPLDVTNETSVKVALETVIDALDALETDLWAVINNAGVCIFGEFDWLTMEHCSSQVEVNLLGTMRVTKYFLPLIRKSKGRIVTITSVNGCVAYPGLSVYSATKFGLEGFCDSLRREVAKYGVRVVVVQPGDFARLTNIMAGHKDRAEEMWAAMSEEDRDFYDAVFHRCHEFTLKNYGITSPKSFESSPLLNDVTKAVFSPSPAARYQSASFSFRLIFRLLSLLPVSLADYFLNMMFKTVFEAN